jgi:hypothetical protein
MKKLAIAAVKIPEKSKKKILLVNYKKSKYKKTFVKFAKSLY